MRLIDADALKEKYPDCRGLAQKLDAAPTVDAVPVVRCEDCEYSKRTLNCGYDGDPIYRCMNDNLFIFHGGNYYCPYGIRREIK